MTPQRQTPPERAGRLLGVPLPVWLGAVLTSVLAALVPVLQYRRLITPSWDNAIFEQTLRSYASLSVPVVDIKGPGFHVLGDHFSPLLALLAPAYAALPDARTLMVLQALLIGWSVLPLGRCAADRLGTVAGTGVALAYGCSFGVQAAVAVDFHEVALAVPLLMHAGVAWLERRWTTCCLWALPLLAVKEDLGLTVAVMGLVLVLGGARRHGVVLGLAGACGALLVVFVLIPVAAGGTAYPYLHGSDQAGRLGLDVLLHGSGEKLRTLLLTFGITGFVALRSPWALLTLPTLVWRFATEKEFYWGLDWHYSLVLMPIVFVAALDALERLAAEWPQVRRLSPLLPALLVAVALAVTAVLRLPFATLTWADTWQASPRLSAAQAVLDRIPPGASVETDIGLITHLASDRRVYWVGTIGTVVPRYVLVDQVSGGWSAPVDPVEYAEQQHPGASYRLVLDRNGYLLAERVR